ncbi:MAG: hypothetical protein RR661_06720, partial [Anaerovoracaceae bacterium]
MKKKLFAMGMTLILMFSLAACGNPEVDISAYEGETLTIVGAQEAPVTFTIKELSEMKCTTKKTESTSDKIGRIEATGPLLDTVLKELGRSTDEFTKIKIYGRDEYEITLDQDFLKKNKVILAFGINGLPLEKDALP